MDTRAIPLLIWILLQFPFGFAVDNKHTPRNISMFRDHVSVWFESPLQEGTKYEKENLAELIELVGETFGTILINPAPQMPKAVLPETLNDSVLLIPDLVAKHNQKNGNKTLKVIVSFTVTDLSDPNNTSTRSSFEMAKFVADRANSIHPDTVDTLLLLDKAILPHKVDTIPIHQHEAIYNSVQTLKSTSKLLKNELGGTSYELGLIIRFQDYLEDNYYLHEILENVDLLVPVIYFDEFYMDPLEEHQFLQDLLDNLEEPIKEKNISAKIIPLISCKPPINRNFEKVSKFLECWQLMSTWAVKNNRSVIMYEAFDQYGDKLQDAGWWRLKSETSTGENLNRKERISASSFVAKAEETFGVTLKSGDAFSSQATVVFDHRVRPNSRNRFYFEKEAREMLELVMSRFTSISIGNENDHLYDMIPNVIPRLVAQLNLEKCKDPAFQPFTIISNIHSKHRIAKFDGSRSVIEPEHTWHVAQSANEIFPGTVRIVAFKAEDEIGQTGWKQTLTLLEMEFGNSTSNNIRIGTYLNLADCNSFLTDDFPTFRVSVLILDITDSISPQLHDQYVDFKLSRLFAEWRNCNESLKANHPAVEVLLQVTCSKLVNIGNIDEEAKCWEIVSTWSKENQVQVIFHQAFETPHANLEFIYEGRNPEQDNMGSWWKLKRGSQYKITKDSFVERFKGLMQDSATITADDDEGDATSLECENHCHTGLAVLVTAIVVGCTSSIIFMVYWYNRRMQRLRRGISQIELM